MSAPNSYFTISSVHKIDCLYLKCSIDSKAASLMVGNSSGLRSGLDSLECITTHVSAFAIIY